MKTMSTWLGDPKRHPPKEVVSTWTSLHDIYNVEYDAYTAAYSEANTQWCDLYAASLHDIYNDQ